VLSGVPQIDKLGKSRITCKNLDGKKTASTPKIVSNNFVRDFFIA
jgi:hypothetical protein